MECEDELLQMSDRAKSTEVNICVQESTKINFIGKKAIG